MNTQKGIEMRDRSKKKMNYKGGCKRVWMGQEESVVARGWVKEKK